MHDLPLSAPKEVLQFKNQTQDMRFLSHVYSPASSTASCLLPPLGPLFLQPLELSKKLCICFVLLPPDRCLVPKQVVE
jgi:hypothetical protein